MRLSVGAASLAGRTNECTVSDNRPGGVASESTHKEGPLALRPRLVRTMGLDRTGNFISLFNLLREASIKSF